MVARSATVPSTGDIDEFRERVVAYMIGARDDFAEADVAADRYREAQYVIQRCTKSSTTQYP